MMENIVSILESMPIFFLKLNWSCLLAWNIKQITKGLYRQLETRTKKLIFTVHFVMTACFCPAAV